MQLLLSMLRSISFALFAVFALGACQSTSSLEKTMKKDSHSFAQPEKARVTHLNLKLEVNMEQKQLRGKANWKVVYGHSVDTVVLDTDRLTIEQVSVNGAPVQYRMGTTDSILGTPLFVPLPLSSHLDSIAVEIHYSTHPEAGALQWLSPGQTNGKTHPFLFTQSQAILARSWIPCQDGPGIRFTYSADISVPTPLMALMSAENPQKKSPDGHYSFRMPQAIPSYLMALAVGDLAFAPLSERAGVYAEPAFLPACAQEFVDVEKMIQSAESIYGPYAWGRYDLLVLPASFPFGGMENPRLTFATPTIVAGDRSLVSLVAHELAHSWSGNLVTNATWNDFWLNEGFTVYFENRIMEGVYGKDYADMLAVLSHGELIETIEEFSISSPNDTKLDIDLKGRNPDDGVTAIAYEKGFHFLLLIEKTIGRPRWDAFLTGYFSQNGFGTMTTERLEELLTTELLSPEEIASIGVSAWIHDAGLPTNCPTPHARRFDAVDAALLAFGKERILPSSSATKKWSTHEWLRFLQGLNDLSTADAGSLDEAFDFTHSGNAEILVAWFQVAATSNYSTPELADKIRSFLIRVGRRKFLTPTYKALLENGQAERARAIYAEARPGYHAVAKGTMDDLLDYR